MNKHEEETPGSPSPIAQDIRAKRLNQVAGMCLVSLLGLAAIYAAKPSWILTLLLLSGSTMMAASLWLNRRGKTDRATLLLLYSLTATVCGAIWRGEGLHDTVQLAFPTILIIAGLLAQRSHFFLLLGLILIFNCLLAIATFHYGLRVSQAERNTHIRPCF